MLPVIHHKYQDLIAVFRTNPDHHRLEQQPQQHTAQEARHRLSLSLLQLHFASSDAKDRSVYTHTHTHIHTLSLSFSSRFTLRLTADDTTKKPKEPQAARKSTVGSFDRDRDEIPKPKDARKKKKKETLPELVERLCTKQGQRQHNDTVYRIESCQPINALLSGETKTTTTTTLHRTSTNRPAATTTGGIKTRLTKKRT